MLMQQVRFLLPPHGTATVTLPEVMTPDTFARLDRAIGAALRAPCQQGGADATHDPGTVEFDSWSTRGLGQGVTS